MILLEIREAGLCRCPLLPAHFRHGVSELWNLFKQDETALLHVTNAVQVVGFSGCISP